MTGAVTKGRSSSVPLSGFLRRLAALCFAGGLLLHCVCVPKSHNPGDWPSRGLRLPGRRSRPVDVSRCPASGVAAQRHPLHMSKRLRGKGFSCGAASFAHVGGDWWPQVVLDFLRRMEVKRHRGLLYRSLQGWAIIAVSRLHLAISSFIVLLVFAEWRYNRWSHLPLWGRSLGSYRNGRRGGRLLLLRAICFCLQWARCAWDGRLPVPRARWSLRPVGRRFRRVSRRETLTEYALRFWSCAPSSCSSRYFCREVVRAHSVERRQ